MNNPCKDRICKCVHPDGGNEDRDLRDRGESEVLLVERAKCARDICGEFPETGHGDYPAVGRFVVDGLDGVGEEGDEEEDAECEGGGKGG